MLFESIWCWCSVALCGFENRRSPNPPSRGRQASVQGAPLLLAASHQKELLPAWGVHHWTAGLKLRPVKYHEISCEMTCFCWFQERSLFLPRCLCRPDVSTMIRSYFSFLKSSTPASVGRPCWVGSLLPFRPKVASLPPQSSLDPSHCSRHRKVFSPWPVHWQHPKASEGNRRLDNNSRLSLHVKRRTMSYVLA